VKKLNVIFFHASTVAYVFKCHHINVIILGSRSSCRSGWNNSYVCQVNSAAILCAQWGAAHLHQCIIYYCDIEPWL